MTSNTQAWIWLKDHATDDEIGAVVQVAMLAMHQYPNYRKTFPQGSQVIDRIFDAIERGDIPEPTLWRSYRRLGVPIPLPENPGTYSAKPMHASIWGPTPKGKDSCLT